MYIYICIVYPVSPLSEASSGSLPNRQGSSNFTTTKKEGEEKERKIYAEKGSESFIAGPSHRFKEKEKVRCLNARSNEFLSEGRGRGGGGHAHAQQLYY